MNIIIKNNLNHKSKALKRFLFLNSKIYHNKIIYLLKRNEMK